jgi:CubicO group peptidase (beta-lactamase class C family)
MSAAISRVSRASWHAGEVVHFDDGAAGSRQAKPLTPDTIFRIYP